MTFIKIFFFSTNKLGRNMRKEMKNNKFSCHIDTECYAICGLIHLMLFHLKFKLTSFKKVFFFCRHFSDRKAGVGSFVRRDVSMLFSGWGIR